MGKWGCAGCQTCLDRGAERERKRILAILANLPPSALVTLIAAKISEPAASPGGERGGPLGRNQALRDRHLGIVG